MMTEEVKYRERGQTFTKRIFTTNEKMNSQTMNKYLQDMKEKITEQFKNAEFESLKSNRAKALIESVKDLDDLDLDAGNINEELIIATEYNGFKEECFNLIFTIIKELIFECNNFAFTNLKKMKQRRVYNKIDCIKNYLKNQSGQDIDHSAKTLLEEERQQLERENETLSETYVVKKEKFNKDLFIEAEKIINERGAKLFREYDGVNTSTDMQQAAKHVLEEFFRISRFSRTHSEHQAKHPFDKIKEMILEKYKNELNDLKQDDEWLPVFRTGKHKIRSTLNNFLDKLSEQAQKEFNDDLKQIKERMKDRDPLLVKREVSGRGTNPWPNQEDVEKSKLKYSMIEITGQVDHKNKSYEIIMTRSTELVNAIDQDDDESVDSSELTDVIDQDDESVDSCHFTYSEIFQKRMIRQFTTKFDLNKHIYPVFVPVKPRFDKTKKELIKSHIHYNLLPEDAMPVIVSVSSSCYDEFCALYEEDLTNNKFFIMKVPDTFSSGCVRKSLMMLAEHFDLPCFWLIDDNVCECYEYCHELVSHYPLTSSSLERTMLHVQKIMHSELQVNEITDEDVPEYRKYFRSLSIAIKELNDDDDNDECNDNDEDLKNDDGAKSVARELEPIIVELESNQSTALKIQDNIIGVMQKLANIKDNLSKQNDKNAKHRKTLQRIRQVYDKLVQKQDNKLMEVSQITVLNKEKEKAKYSNKLNRKDYSSHYIIKDARSQMVLYNGVSIRGLHPATDEDFMSTENISTNSNNDDICKIYNDELFKHKRGIFAAYRVMMKSEKFDNTAKCHREKKIEKKKQIVRKSQVITIDSDDEKKCLEKKIPMLDAAERVLQKNSILMNAETLYENIKPYISSKGKNPVKYLKEILNREINNAKDVRSKGITRFKVINGSYGLNKIRYPEELISLKNPVKQETKGKKRKSIEAELDGQSSKKHIKIDKEQGKRKQDKKSKNKNNTEKKKEDDDKNKKAKQYKKRKSV
jgi:hypothetical protein